MTEDDIDSSDWRSLANAGLWDWIDIIRLTQDEAQFILDQISELVPLIEEQDGMMTNKRHLTSAEIGFLTGMADKERAKMAKAAGVRLFPKIEIDQSDAILRAAKVLEYGELAVVAEGRVIPTAGEDWLSLKDAIAAALERIFKQAESEGKTGPITRMGLVDYADAARSELESQIATGMRSCQNEDDRHFWHETLSGVAAAAFRLGAGLQAADGKDTEFLAAIGIKHAGNPSKGGQAKAANFRANNPELIQRMAALANAGKTQAQAGRVLSDEFEGSFDAMRSRYRRYLKKRWAAAEQRPSKR